MITRRHSVIRTLTALTGDVAIGTAMATACAWIVQSAALGLFLSFLLWLVAAILGLALSQYLWHPAVRLVLSDRKLDDAANAVSALAEVATVVGCQVSDGLLRHAGSAWQAWPKFSLFSKPVRRPTA